MTRFRTYSYRQHDFGPTIRITAHDHEGFEVARFIFTKPNKKGEIDILDAVVHEDHRRRGIATKAYDMAEDILNGKVIPGYSQTKEATAMWKDRKGRS